MAILRAMRHVVRMVVAIRFALSTRRDLLLEILALRHQLHVLVRSNRRFRPSDRLIRRLAAENGLWGAPRIHGELLKLGIVVSERTVSRYLPDRRLAPSQTWLTFLANHLGQFTFISPETSLYAPGGIDVVDGSGLTFRHTRLSCDAHLHSSAVCTSAWVLRRSRNIGEAQPDAID
jgi:hypothetical protein